MFAAGAPREFARITAYSITDTLLPILLPILAVREHLQYPHATLTILAYY
jgi:hypothetical protein